MCPASESSIFSTPESGDSLDASDSRGYGTLADDFYHSDIACVAYVGASAEFDGFPEFYHADFVTVFLSNNAMAPEGTSLCYRHVAVFLKRNGPADPLIDYMLYLPYLF